MVLLGCVYIEVSDFIFSCREGFRVFSRCYVVEWRFDFLKASGNGFFCDGYLVIFVVDPSDSYSCHRFEAMRLFN